MTVMTWRASDGHTSTVRRQVNKFVPRRPLLQPPIRPFPGVLVGRENPSLTHLTSSFLLLHHYFMQ